MRIKIIVLCSFLGVVAGILFSGVIITAGAELPYDLQNVLSLTNQERSNAGVEALRANDLLQQAAQQKANDMAANGYFSHISPSGAAPKDWLESAGYDWKSCGENIAFNYETADELLAGWMSSSGHRANILSQRFQEIGIGLATGAYKGKEGIFAVQLFASPSQELVPVITPDHELQTNSSSSPEYELTIPMNEEIYLEKPVSPPLLRRNFDKNGLPQELVETAAKQSPPDKKLWFGKYWTESEDKCRILFYSLFDRCIYLTD